MWLKYICTGDLVHITSALMHENEDQINTKKKEAWICAENHHIILSAHCILEGGTGNFSSALL